MCLTGPPRYEPNDAAAELSPGARPYTYRRRRLHAQQQYAPPPPSPPSPPRSPSSPSSPSTSSPSSPNKQLKIKTEMCHYYKHSQTCPWGSKCNYAHGEHELRKTKVMDLLRSGDITNVESYRTRPCMSFVSTGACPFGIRCKDLHDPRVASPHQSWLPHLEQPDRDLDEATDIYMDNLHHQFANSVSHGTPFAYLIPKDMTHPEEGSSQLSDFERQIHWNRFYERICSGRESAISQDDSAGASYTAKDHQRRPPSSTLSERQRLEIVMKMRGGPKADRHKYSPRHEMMGVPCMILQTRTFQIDSGKSIAEVPAGFSDGTDKTKTVVVHEVAFGSDANPFVRGVALWFNVPPSEVTLRRPAFKTSRSNLRQRRMPPATSRMDEYLRTAADSPFYLIRPGDEDAFDLSSLILEHRLKTLRAVDAKNAQLQRVELAALHSEKLQLRASFESLCRHWSSGKWDKNANGFDEIDEDTVSPDVETEYRTKQPSCGGKNGTPKLWDSFVQQVGHKSSKQGSSSKIESARARLPVFKLLAEGLQLTPSRSAIPKMKKPQRFVPQRHNLEVCPSRRTRCWQELLRTHPHGEDGGKSEWDMLYDHFVNKK